MIVLEPKSDSLEFGHAVQLQRKLTGRSDEVEVFRSRPRSAAGVSRPTFWYCRGIEPGNAPGMDDFGQSDSEQVQVVPFKRVEQRAIVSSLFDQRMRAQPAHITMLLGAS